MTPAAKIALGAVALGGVAFLLTRKPSADAPVTPGYSAPSTDLSTDGRPTRNTLGTDGAQILMNWIGGYVAGPDKSTNAQEIVVAGQAPPPGSTVDGSQTLGHLAENVLAGGATVLIDPTSAAAVMANDPSKLPTNPILVATSGPDLILRAYQNGFVIWYEPTA